jgi:hypothetical protein
VPLLPYLAATQQPPSPIVVLVLAVAGFFTPDLILRAEVKRRRQAIFLDLREASPCRDLPTDRSMPPVAGRLRAARYDLAMDERQLRKKRDRELIELLSELRVALPGAQVLFAFLLIAPSAYHRLRWRERDKERMLRTANRMAIAGLACIAVAMSASVFLVSDVLLPRWAAAVITAAAAVVFLSAWFVLPLATPYDRWDDRDLTPEDIDP